MSEHTTDTVERLEVSALKHHEAMARLAVAEADLPEHVARAAKLSREAAARLRKVAHEWLRSAEAS